MEQQDPSCSLALKCTFNHHSLIMEISATRSSGNFPLNFIMFTYDVILITINSFQLNKILLNNFL